MTALKQLGAMLLGGVVLLVIWGAAIEPRWLLDVETHEAPVPDLPPSWEGGTVALLADLQIGMWWDNVGMVRKAVAAAVDADPALILIAGDFVYAPDSAVVREAVSLVRPLTAAGVPVVAVLGNHDYSAMKEDSEVREDLARYLASELDAAGITVLENEAIAIDAPGGGAPLYVAGVGSEWVGRSRPGQALAGVPADAATLVLMHNPVAFRELPAGTGLALAAHTHGGQVRIPLLPSESWLDIARPREVVADGWAEEGIGEEGNRLYVTRGLGFSAVPVRIFCRPELTLLTLRREAGGAAG